MIVYCPGAQDEELSVMQTPQGWALMMDRQAASPSVCALPQPFPPPMAVPSAAAAAAAYLGLGPSLGALWHRLGSGLVGVCLTPGQ